MDHLKAIELAFAAELSGRELLLDHAKREAQCNGIGPAWFPAPLRSLISWRNPTITVASFIHDRRYCEGGRLRDRLAADLEFGRNSVRLGCRKYRWFDPRRYVVAVRAVLYTALLLVAGGTAYNYHKG